MKVDSDLREMHYQSGSSSSFTSQDRCEASVSASSAGHDSKMDAVAQFARDVAFLLKTLHAEHPRTWACPDKTPPEPSHFLLGTSKDLGLSGQILGYSYC